MISNIHRYHSCVRFGFRKFWTDQSNGFHCIQYRQIMNEDNLLYFFESTFFVDSGSISGVLCKWASALLSTLTVGWVRRGRRSNTSLSFYVFQNMNFQSQMEFRDWKVQYSKNSFHDQLVDRINSERHRNCSKYDVKNKCKFVVNIICR